MEPRNPQLDDDRKLIILCQEGDRAAFERLYRRYARDVYTMALRMVYSEEIAEEVTQEVFISIYKDIQKFQFQSAFTTWLYRIVYRRAADQFRKNRKHRDHTISFIQDDSVNPFFDVPDSGSTPSDQAMENERIRMIEKAISSLSPKQRSIMLLRYVQNFSYEEIAQILKCRIGTVKSRLNRAHKTLEEKLDIQEMF